MFKNVRLNKKIEKIMLTLCPYLLSGAATFVIVDRVYRNAEIPAKANSVEYVDQTWDKLGNLKSSNQTQSWLENTSELQSTITVVSNWTKVEENNKYKQETRKYEIDNLSLDFIRELVQSDLDYLKYLDENSTNCVIENEETNDIDKIISSEERILLNLYDIGNLQADILQVIFTLTGSLIGGAMLHLCISKNNKDKNKVKVKN